MEFETTIICIAILAHGQQTPKSQMQHGDNGSTQYAHEAIGQRTSSRRRHRRQHAFEWCVQRLNISHCQFTMLTLLQLNSQDATATTMTDQFLEPTQTASSLQPAPASSHIPTTGYGTTHHSAKKTSHSRCKNLDWRYLRSIFLQPFDRRHGQLPNSIRVWPTYYPIRSALLTGLSQARALCEKLADRATKRPIVHGILSVHSFYFFLHI